MGALPLGVFQILAAEFSRMGGTFYRAVGLGACPATRQGTPCRGEGVSLRMDSRRVLLLARPCGSWRDQISHGPGQAPFAPDLCHRRCRSEHV